jgi:hypothetical protein
MQIDRIIYATPDLDAAVVDIERRFGVRAGGGGRHLAMGTRDPAASTVGPLADWWAGPWRATTSSR